MEYKIFKEKRGVEPLRGLSQQLAIAHTYRCITLPKFKLALIIEHPPGPGPSESPALFKNKNPCGGGLKTREKGEGRREKIRRRLKY